MNYQVFKPTSDLEPVVKCYWTLEVPFDAHAERQRIVPDGCIEMIFILGDDVKRYTAQNEFVIQPRAMILGQITEPYIVQPTGYVYSFAVRFYPYGFAHFIKTPIDALANKETPLADLFGDESAELHKQIIDAPGTDARIACVEAFLLKRLGENATIDHIVQATIDILISKKGNASVNSILTDPSKRRQLERKFAKQIGMSPKQLGKVIRLQAALKLLLNAQSQKLTDIAYESEYYDQAHFIKDFKEFTGITPREFLDDDTMSLSALLYKND
jgi:hypothetical protein